MDNKIKEIQDRITRKAEQVQRIYDRTEDKVIEPGYYDVVETDGGGKHDIIQFQIKVETPTNMKDIAVTLMDEMNHFNAWGYLQLRKSAEPKLFTIK